MEGFCVYASTAGIQEQSDYKVAMNVGRGLYWVATMLLSPFAGLIMSRRIRAGKENPNTLSDRYAKTSSSRPDGHLIWLHGASVGETLVLLELARAMRRRGRMESLLFSCQTQTAAETIKHALERYPEFQASWTKHVMAPLDLPHVANRFVNHWEPDLTLVAEGDIWPNLLSHIKRSEKPAALVNARMTDKSIRGWARWPGSAKAVFSIFDEILASDTRSRDGLKQILGREISLPGNLKSALPPPEADEEQLRDIKQLIGGRPILVAASTHEGEEALILDAMMAISPAPFLILAPRHPERGDWVESLLSCTKFKTARRSRRDSITNETDILLADTLGEMGLWYRLADTVYLGGGHAPGVGGHNPIEPLRLGKPVMTGPSVFNFEDVVANLKAISGIHIVDSAEEISRQFPLRPPNTTVRDHLEAEANKPMDETLSAIEKLLPKTELSA